jgi:hypothetical protein
MTCGAQSLQVSFKVGGVQEQCRIPRAQHRAGVVMYLPLQTDAKQQTVRRGRVGHHLFAVDERVEGNAQSASHGMLSASRTLSFHVSFSQ